MPFRFLKSPSTSEEIQEEKSKDYRNVVITQIVIVSLGLILYTPLLEDPNQPISKFLITLFSGFGLLYAFLLWDLLKNFTSSKVLLNLILIVLVGISVFGTLIEFPYYTVIQNGNRQLSLLIIHTLLFPIEVIVISFCIRDIFLGQYFSPDKLWGSACVFLMIGISFGSLYDIICIVSPGSLCETIHLGIPNYSECVSYSFHILGGIDTEYPNASKLIKNISVIEAVWGNLFTVLIIGKLMILPRQPDKRKI
jgi:hypothetical protein